MVIGFTVLLGVISLFQPFFWFFYFNSLKNHTTKQCRTNNTPPLSLVVCTKNDLENLKENIELWLNQDIKDLELLIVDDFSGIETEVFIEKLQRSKGSLSYHKVMINKPGKKQAIKEGLSNCRHNWVLFTDTDCKPGSSTWAASMVNTAITQNKQLVLGYSPYRIPKPIFLYKWIHFEAWLTGVLYLSFALKKDAYMGVGRNLLYAKELSKDILFNSSNIPSGDDDLTIQQISTPSNTTINIDPQAFVFSQPENSWFQYVAQKRRHMTTSFYYKSHHKVLLALYPLSQIAFYSLLFLLLINGLWETSCLLYFSRLTYIFFWSFPLMKKLKAQFSFLFIILADFLLVFYYIFFGLIIHLFPKKTW